MVLPLLLIFLVATFETGWALHCGSTVRSTIEQTSRKLISNPDMTESELQAAVENELGDLPVTDLNIDLTREWVTPNAQVTRVAWTVEYNTVMPYVPKALFNFDASIIVPTAAA